MKKDNVLKSSEFHMDEGDILHLLFLDEVGVPITYTLNSINPITGEDNIEEVPDAPTSLPTSDITDTSFTANWNYTENTLGFYLDVAEDSAFTVFVAGYNNLNVGLVNEYPIVGLQPNTDYYYRLRGYNDYGTSPNSNTMPMTTNPLVADDWFLPSLLELQEMYDELYLHSVGGFIAGVYWCSTEFGASWGQVINFASGGTSWSAKGSPLRVRACRTFLAGVGVYSLRDEGQAGGLIFYVDGAGTTYYEAAPTDQSAGYLWSNVAVVIGTTSAAIGEGQNNTNEIIAQVGHVNSAAKLCDDLIL